MVRSKVPAFLLSCLSVSYSQTSKPGGTCLNEPHLALILSIHLRQQLQNPKNRDQAVFPFLLFPTQGSAEDCLSIVILLTTLCQWQGFR